MAVRMLRIAVVDQGIGISGEDQKLLFKPFNQIKAGANQKANGTGLGLAIARRIIEMSGGRIGVNSEEGKGSAFFFEVPIDGPPQSAQTGGAPATVQAVGGAPAADVAAAVARMHPVAAVLPLAAAAHFDAASASPANAAAAWLTAPLRSTPAGPAAAADLLGSHGHGHGHGSASARGKRGQSGHGSASSRSRRTESTDTAGAAGTRGGSRGDTPQQQHAGIMMTHAPGLQQAAGSGWPGAAMPAGMLQMDAAAMGDGAWRAAVKNHLQQQTAMLATQQQQLQQQQQQQMGGARYVLPGQHSGLDAVGRPSGLASASPQAGLLPPIASAVGSGYGSVAASPMALSARSMAAQAAAGSSSTHVHGKAPSGRTMQTQLSGSGTAASHAATASALAHIVEESAREAAESSSAMSANASRSRSATVLQPAAGSSSTTSGSDSSGSRPSPHLSAAAVQHQHLGRQAALPASGVPAPMLGGGAATVAVTSGRASGRLGSTHHLAAAVAGLGLGLGSAEHVHAVAQELQIGSDADASRVRAFLPGAPDNISPLHSHREGGGAIAITASLDSSRRAAAQPAAPPLLPLIYQRSPRGAADAVPEPPLPMLAMATAAAQADALLHHSASRSPRDLSARSGSTMDGAASTTARGASESRIGAAARERRARRRRNQSSGPSQASEDPAAGSAIPQLAVATDLGVMGALSATSRSSVDAPVPSQSGRGPAAAAGDAASLAYTTRSSVTMMPTPQAFAEATVDPAGSPAGDAYAYAGGSPSVSADGGSVQHSPAFAAALGLPLASGLAPAMSFTSPRPAGVDAATLAAQAALAHAATDPAAARASWMAPPVPSLPIAGFSASQRHDADAAAAGGSASAHGLYAMSTASSTGHRDGYGAVPMSISSRTASTATGMGSAPATAGREAWASHGAAQPSLDGGLDLVPGQTYVVGPGGTLMLAPAPAATAASTPHAHAHAQAHAAAAAPGGYDPLSLLLLGPDGRPLARGAPVVSPRDTHGMWPGYEGSMPTGMPTAMYHRGASGSVSDPMAAAAAALALAPGSARSPRGGADALLMQQQMQFIQQQQQKLQHMQYMQQMQGMQSYPLPHGLTPAAASPHAHAHPHADASLSAAAPAPSRSDRDRDERRGPSRHHHRDGGGGGGGGGSSSRSGGLHSAPIAGVVPARRSRGRRGSAHLPPLGPGQQYLRRAVVIDDVKSNRDLFAALLSRRLGVEEVLKCDGGHAAITLAQSMATDETRDSYVWFSDKNMPVVVSQQFSSNRHRCSVTTPIAVSWHTLCR